VIAFSSGRLRYGLIKSVPTVTLNVGSGCDFVPDRRFMVGFIRSPVFGVVSGVV